MSEDDSREARRARWSAGTPLTLAFLKYGNERQRRQHVKARGTGYTQPLEDLMTGDIFGMIAAEDLVAWGYRTAPTLSDGPIQVPPDVFDQPLPGTWRDDIVSASGETYERITVSRTTDIGGEPHSKSAPPIAQIEDSPVIDRGGPRDTYALSEPVLRALQAENESLIVLSAERLLPTFQETFRSIHPEIAKLRPPPGLRTLRKQLARFRAERSGNNRQ